MTRPRLARFALLLLVSGGLAPPRVEALDPPSVYIQRYEFETTARRSLRTGSPYGSSTPRSRDAHGLSRKRAPTWP
jgi:hypothetical protein